jgi:hypothetical protein
VPQVKELKPISLHNRLSIGKNEIRNRCGSAGISCPVLGRDVTSGVAQPTMKSAVIAF